MEMSSILAKIAVLFLIMGVGYAANRLGILNDSANKQLSKLVISIPLPAYILANAMSNSSASPQSVLTMLGLSFAHYALMALLTWYMPRLMHVQDSQIGTYRFMLNYGNTGFLGFPVVAAILGEEAVFSATLFNLPFNLLVYTFGVIMLSSGNGVKLNPRLLLTPAVIACTLAIPIVLLPFQYPSILVDTCQMLGASTTPMALLVIGSTLASIPPRQMAGSPQLYIMTLFRLVFMPLLMWVLLRGVISDPTTLGVTVIQAGMPVATSGTMLTLIYGGDHQLITQGTLITTVLSLLTIPLMALLLQV